MTDNHVLAEKNVKKLLVKLSLPAMVGMFVMALYNLVDTVFVGRGIGSMAIAGLSIVFPVQMIVMGVGQLVGIGSGSAISRFIGSGEIDKAKHVLGNALFYTTTLSVIITMSGIIFMEPLLRLFGASETVLPYARDYMEIIIYGTILFTTAMSLNHILRAEGRPKIAMMTMIIGAVGNIILDPIFIFVLNMGVSGAALATVLAQSVSVIYVLIAIRKGSDTLRLSLHHLIPSLPIIKEITAIGMSSFSRNIAGSMIFALINNKLGYYGGDIAIAAYGIIQRLIRFLLMPLFGIAQGLQPIVGYNYGAKRPEKIKEANRAAIISATTMALLGFTLIQLFPRIMFSIFTTNPVLIDVGAKASRLMVLLIPLIGFQVVGTTMFQALGKALPSLILALSREILFLIPVVLILPLFIGVNGVWLAFPIADFFAFALTLILYLRFINSMKKDKIRVETESFTR